MKNIVLILSILPFLVIAQTEKGTTLLSPSHTLTFSPSVTRAVVIGISDYQDEAIPGLRFAHEDANSFARWLMSPAGGSIPNGNIKLLTNEMATTAQFFYSLDWLLDETELGGQAIIYFAGHSDVETKTTRQNGFLLTYDAPHSNYMAGAIPVAFLQDIVTTLSVEKKAQVTLFLDVSHAGILEGSAVGGTQIAAASLARQFANEVKIFSCQPDEFSFEGQQWGGGRSAFSYHLLRGLYGLADVDSNGEVSLVELDSYLGNQVSTEVAPMSQHPFTTGDRTTKLATVSMEMLDLIRQPKRSLKMLEQAISTGSRNYDQIFQDANLTPLWDLPEFRALMKKYHPDQTKD